MVSNSLQKIRTTARLISTTVLFLFVSIILNAQENDTIQNSDTTFNTSSQQKVMPVKGFPVLGATNDTLFYIYEKFGSYKPAERAEAIRERILNLVNDDFVKWDSIKTVSFGNSVDIVLGETIIMSISEADAAANNSSLSNLSDKYADIIKEALIHAKEEGSVLRLVTRIGLVLLVLGGTWLILF